MRILNALEPKILVAEDDALVSELVSLNLVRDGYRVTQAWSGFEALRLLARTSPALMLLDLGLPMVDGFGVLAEIRRRRVMKQLIGPAFPIIVMTARQTADNVMKALALGADDFLAKPFEIPDLMSRVAEQLGVPRQS
ncbi:MAG TPA: response regulator transcription factor [Caulobacteraceae bacterium]|jgi:two-component system response regulator AdeR